MFVECFLNVLNVFFYVLFGFIFVLVNELKYMKQNNTSTDTRPVQFSGVVIGALADAFGKHISTIERWIAAEDDRLTSDKAKKVYEQFGQNP